MSIVSVKERIGRAGTRTRGGGRTYERVYLVNTSIPDEPEISVRTAPGIPQMMSNHPNDGTALVTRIDPRQLDANPKYWEVVVSYESLNVDPARENDNPLFRPPDIVWSFIKVKKEAFYALDSSNNPKKLENSKKQALTGIEIESSRPVVRISRNEVSFIPSVAASYQDAVNSDALTIAGLSVTARQAKMEGISGSYHVDNAVGYYRVVYEIEFERDTWDVKIVDSTHDAQGNLVLLDGNGAPLAAGANIVLLGPFNFHKQLPFASLGLP